MNKRKNTGNRLLSFAALMIAAGTIFIVGQRSTLFRPVLSGILTFLSPVTGLLENGAQATENINTPPEDYDELQGRVVELERSVAELQVEIVRLREIEQDYYRLSGITNYVAQRPDENIVTADVIALDVSSYLRWIVINRGARDGIQIGDPVINDQGLVGRVEDVAANASWIRLIIDPSSTVDVRLQNARAEGNLIGKLQGDLFMQFIPQNIVIEEGDLVLTSGLGGLYPANIVIGQVTSVRTQPAALFQEAEVRPTVDFDDLDIVAVVTDFQPIDLSVFEDVITTQEVP